MSIIKSNGSKQEQTGLGKFLPLDKAGIIYPYVATNDWNSVYRVEAKLNHKLDFQALRCAVEQCRKKHPYYFMTVAKENKCFVLKEGSNANVICENVYPLCRPFDLKSGNPLVRVIYDSSTIAIEFFHALTDGHGAERFFKILLESYYSFRKFSSAGNLHVVTQRTTINNLCDVYEKFSKSGGKSVSRFVSKAYQFKKEDESELRAKAIEVPVSNLKKAAKSKGVSITMLVCALQLAAILQSEKTGNKTVRISVPVDIRHFANTDSDRNGALYILVGIKAKDVKSFDDILKSVKEQFEKELTAEKMQNLAYSNVKTAHMKAFEMLPIALKKFALNIGYTAFGEDQFTSTLTNTGIIDLSDHLKEIVSDAYFILGKQKTKPINIALSTYNGIAKIMVSSVYKNEKFTDTLCELMNVFGITQPQNTPDSAENISIKMSV